MTEHKNNSNNQQQSSFNDKFLHALEDLSDSDDEVQQEQLQQIDQSQTQQDRQQTQQQVPHQTQLRDAKADDRLQQQNDNDEEDDQSWGEQIDTNQSNLNQQDSDNQVAAQQPSISEYRNLQKDSTFLTHLAKLQLDKQSDNNKSSDSTSVSTNFYDLVAKTNDYLKIIAPEIMYVHKTLRDLYHCRFAELESIITNSVDYAKAVKIIGNNVDVSDFSALLTGLVSNTTAMSLTVAFSATQGQQFQHNQLIRVFQVADEVITLDQQRSDMLSYLENKMHLIAPNTCAIVGSSITAKLISSAGGIQELSRIPASNIQVLGQQKKNLNGLSTASAQLHRGHLGELDLVQQAPPKFQIQVIRMLSTKIALASRVDACQTYPNGEQGVKMREQIIVRYGKISAPQQSKLRKMLPKPDDKPRKKRAGKKFQNMRLKYQMTMQRKMQNTMAFGPDAQQEYRDTGKGLGLLGVAAGIGGKLKVNVNKDQKILKKRALPTVPTGGFGFDKNSSAMTSGLQSSLAMTPLQGIELINPDLLQQKVRKAQQSNIL